MTKRGRGRPAWVPTAEQRDTVEIMAAVGRTEIEICRALGVTQKTLRKQCLENFRLGPMRKRAELAVLLFKSARSGNVAALKKLVEMTDTVAAEVAFTAPEADPVRKLGKKEEAALAAQTAAAGTEWAADLGLGEDARPN